MRTTHLILIAVTAALSAGSARAALIAQYELEANAVNSVNPGTGDGVWQPLDPASAAYSAGIAPSGTTSAAFDSARNINVDASAIGLDTSSAYSISFWVSSSVAGDSFITNGTDSRGTFAQRDFDFFTTNATTLVFSAHTGGAENWRINATASVTNGATHHIVGTWDGTTDTDGVKLYVDGNLVGFDTAASIADNDHNTLLLGGSTGGFGYNGLLDDVRIYDHSFSASEVTALFGGVTGPVGLVDHYKLDGDGVDSAGGDANGTVGSNVGFVAGVDGQAGSFPTSNAADNRITVPQADAFDPGVGDFTIAFWVKHPTTNPNDFDAVLDGLSSNGFQIFILDSPNQLRIRLDGSLSAGENFDSTFALADDEFQHVAVTVNRTTQELIWYLDGVAETPLSIAGILGDLTPSQDLWIGGANTTSGLNGELDDLRFYDTVLSASEIQALAGVTNAVPTPAALPVGLAMLGGIAARRRR